MFEMDECNTSVQPCIVHDIGDAIVLSTIHVCVWCKMEIYPSHTFSEKGKSFVNNGNLSMQKPVSRWVSRIPLFYLKSVCISLWRIVRLATWTAK